MMYLTLRLTSEDGTFLYSKDVEPVNAFEPFVRALVAQLVERGEIKVGEHYTALIVPRYVDSMIAEPIRSVDSARAAEDLMFIEMRTEEPMQPETLIRFFTAELRVRESGLIFRQDFHMLEVAAYFVAYGIEQALLSLGVLQQGQRYRAAFYARDDDNANFDKEHIPSLEQQAADLIEFLSEETEEPSFPFRDPSLYAGVEYIGEPASGEVQIFIHRPTLERLRQEATASEQVELGGILVGNIYRPTGGQGYLVEISDYIVSEGIVSTETELVYTFESWQGHQAMLRTQFPGKRIVGWYHTHLIEMTVKLEATQQTHSTTMFFSQHDVFLHSQFFSEPWYVALVLDPWGRSQFFGWKDRKIMPCAAYAIFNGIGVAT